MPLTVINRTQSTLDNEMRLGEFAQNESFSSSSQTVWALAVKTMSDEERDQLLHFLENSPKDASRVIEYLLRKIQAIKSNDENAIHDILADEEGWVMQE